MEKEYLQLLLRKYLRAEATKEETRYIESYYDLFENEPEVLNTLNAEEKIKLKNEIREAVDRSAGSQERGGKLISFFRKKAFRVAAAVVFIIVIVSVLYQNRRLSESRGAGMLTVRAQSTQTILLADGSEVIMSPGSNLRYPESFNGEKREVFLEGQAFFDIAHNPSRPFVVHAGKIQTKVLGTAFFVKAFEDDDYISVTVTRGKVQVNDSNKQLGILIRNEQILYDRKREAFVQNKVNSDSLSSWARKELIIDNLTLTEAVALLERQFNVAIQVEDNLASSKRFNATFPPSLNLDQALKTVCEFNELKYRYNERGDSVFIGK